MPAPFPSILNLPANPVFRRHAVARLRPVPLLVWVLLTQTLAGFGWALGFLVTLRVRSGELAGLNIHSPEFRGMLAEHGLQAALVAWIIVLTLQAIIVFFKGTFSVATGVARESGEGMMDAQRLTPLPTGHKVAGQLAGLPVQENLVAGLLTIWVIPSVIFGGLPLMLVLKMYLILATSALLHHAIGLVAGTIIRQKILAGTLSQVLVIVLNFGLPLAGYFGIGAISHLGTGAAISELFQNHLGDHNPFNAGQTAVDWFGHPLPAAFYTWVLIVIGLGMLVAIIHRRWNDETSQILGKPGTVAAVAALLLVSWGEFHGFTPSPGLTGRYENAGANGETMGPIMASTMIWIAGFATVLGLLNLLAATIIAPSPVQRGLHRHAARPRPWHDGAPAIPWLLAICLLTTLTFHGVCRPILATAGAPAMHPTTLGFVAASFVLPACAWLLAIVRLGWRGAAILAFFCGVLPMLLAALVAVVTGDLLTLARWILAVSGAFLPMFAWFSGSGGQSPEIAGPLRAPFLLSLALHAVFLAWLSLRKPAKATRGARNRTRQAVQPAASAQP